MRRLFEEQVLKRQLSLRQRVPWMFVLANVLLAVLAPVRLTYPDAPGWPGNALMVACFVGLGVWAVLYHRAEGRSLVFEVLPYVLVVVGSVAEGELEGAYARIMVIVLLTGLYGSGLRRLLWVGMAAAGSYEAVAYLVGDQVGTHLLSFGFGVFLLAAIMQTVGATLKRHQLLRERDATLTDVAAELLIERDPDRIAQVIAEGALRLVDAPGSIATVYRGDGEHLELTAEAGEVTTRVQRVELASLPPDLRDLYRQGRTGPLEGERLELLQERFGANADHVSAMVAPIMMAGEPRGLIYIGSPQHLDEDLQDVLARFAQEASLSLQLGERETLLRGIVDNSSDLIVVVDAEERMTFVSPAVRRLVARRPEDLVGAPLSTLLVATDSDMATSAAMLACSTPTPMRLRGPEGDAEVEVTGNDLDSSAHVLNVRDISERRRLEAEITYRAFHDAVTGLPNRGLLLDRLSQALNRAQREGTQVAVAMIDLDDFKRVNDRMGHAVGDDLLVEVARRLESVLRASDTAARFGGDEFAILVDGLESGDEAGAVADRALRALQEPLTLEGVQVKVSASIGVAVAPLGADPDEVLRDADAAMYAAKASGKSQRAVFEPEMHARTQESLELRGELEAAIEAEQFVVHYQPIMDLRSETLVGVEALVRWDHPTRGVLPPLDFIELAEETGLIVPLGRWVLREACRQMARWDEQHPESTIHLAVNMSSVQLRRRTIIDDVSAILEETGLEPGRLTLEVTETALMVDTAAIGRVLAELRKLGVRVAIDDFGTGYSSFAHLQRFPVDIIKVDRAFVSVIEQGPEQAALAEAIVKLARTLGLQTVAEGVERAGEAGTLSGWGCGQAQGWLWSKARPADEIGEELDRVYSGLEIV